ncbi:serine hydrolase [Nocardiopsis akebiae]|uniref:Beta-lactamase n=1 Tax=Nocardiopsis akebiae TaxID=2831968 RepID=A0ABX8CDR4_9ACTN|nr:serine hydrolase [Nocardiopsis akebiae]QUX31153.1 serine hydrolase [Nocardiopsis akebiae]
MSADRTPAGYRRPARSAALVLAAALTAGSAAAPAAAAPAAVVTAAAQEPICTSESHPDLARRLDEGIRERVDEREGTVAVGVSAHGGDLTCGLDPDAEFDAASVGKVVVLGALLRTAMDENRELTAEERDLATAMITVSDNDAATELRNRVGAERIQRFLDLAGMDATKPDPEGYVGLMGITVSDQLTLLRLLRTDNDVLGQEEREFARGLMGDVIGEQRWGVPSGAPADAQVHLKNGWLPHTDTGLWRVHSIGGFRDTPVGDYDIVVLTDDNDGMRYGVDTVESVAAEVHSGLTGQDVRIGTPPTDLTRPLSDGSDGSDGSGRA